ncbi:MAG: hypothetical protein ABIJ30_04700 [bacterium]
MVGSEEIKNIRDRNYRRIPKFFVRTEDEAVEFIDEIGFCFLFPQKYEMPSLWGAMCDYPYPAADCGWDDPIVNLIWGDGKTIFGWRDTLPKSKRVFFGKAIAQKPSFISLKYLPYFYACCSVPDYIQEYKDGKMSHLAKKIYEFLLGEGPTPTGNLRKSVGMSGKQNKYRFEQAMVGLQSKFLVAKVDAVPGFCVDVWDVMERWMPAAIKESTHIGRKEAMKEILAKYMKTVVTAQSQEIIRLFGWDKDEVDGVMNQLIDVSSKNKVETNG